MSKRGDSIHKRKDGRWEGRYKKERKSDGTIRYGSVYGKTYREVREKLLMIQREPQYPRQTAKKEITLGEVLDMWMENNRIRLKGGTINKYQNIIDKHILADLGNVRMSQLSSTRINAFLDDKRRHGRRNGKGGLSASYVRSIMLVIQAAITFAVKEQLCTPLKTPIYKPSEEKKELPVLHAEEQKKLERCLKHDPNPTKVGIMISLYTGMRIGEVCALLWEDIDLRDKIIHVRHTIARVPDSGKVVEGGSHLIIDTPKTRASRRDIPISSMLLQVLARAEKDAVSRYVVSDTGQFVSPRTYEYRYHRILESAGIAPINYHALRHTFATRCIEAGVDVKSLSEILGHATVGITLNTYVHSSMELKRNQLEKLCIGEA